MSLAAESDLSSKNVEALNWFTHARTSPVFANQYYITLCPFAAIPRNNDAFRMAILIPYSNLFRNFYYDDFLLFFNVCQTPIQRKSI